MIKTFHDLNDTEKLSATMSVFHIMSNLMEHSQALDDNHKCVSSYLYPDVNNLYKMFPDEWTGTALHDIKTNIKANNDRLIDTALMVLDTELKQDEFKPFELTYYTYHKAHI